MDVFDGTVYRRLLGDPLDPTLLTVEQRVPDAVNVRLEGPDAARFDPTSVVRRALGKRSSRGIQQKPDAVEAATPLRPEALRDITMTSAVDITPVNNSFKPGPELP